MLKSLTVTNFALIEQAHIEWVSGLNIVTGETGAGKSIFIDALSTILGNRASTDFIRGGCEFFRVEAVFDISGQVELQELCDQQEITVEEDGTLIVSRRLARNGKNSALINGCHVPIHILRQFGERLVDMHGQHENQALLRPETHRAVLDTYDPAIRLQVDLYRSIYRRWMEIRKERAATETRSREREQRMDMLEWQVKEIAAAHLKIEEEQQLEAEIKVLDNAEKIANAVRHSYTLLNQSSKGAPGVISALADIKHEMEIAMRYDERVAPILTTICDALYQLEEITTDLRDYNESLEFDGNRLSKLQERMNIIYKLKKKYGSTIEEILDYYEKAVAELADIANFDQNLVQMAKEQAALESQLAKVADDIHQLREKAARQLAGEVNGHLRDLAMPSAVFRIQVKTVNQFMPQGTDEVVFLFSANRGEELKPLHKVASGGELSRLALAIKTVCASHDSINTMVFDEVDSGIGGQTAQMVAEKIARVACSKQVLCITHLSQIACMADRHIYIEKQTRNQRTQTIVTILTPQQQMEEISRMVSGSDLSQVALDNAAHILDSAKQKKEKWKNQAQA